jgi:hypothetical protein
MALSCRLQKQWDDWYDGDVFLVQRRQDMWNDTRFDGAFRRWFQLSITGRQYVRAVIVFDDQGILWSSLTFTSLAKVNMIISSCSSLGTGILFRWTSRVNKPSFRWESRIFLTAFIDIDWSSYQDTFSPRKYAVLLVYDSLLTISETYVASYHVSSRFAGESTVFRDFRRVR